MSERYKGGQLCGGVTFTIDGPLRDVIARTRRLSLSHLCGLFDLDQRYAALSKTGCPAMGGRMIDASIIEAPRRRTTDAGKDALKVCRLPDAWSANPAGLRRKNRDGRWTLRLFPVDLTSRPGKGIWFKLTNWQAGGAGFVDPDSKRRVRITEDFQIAPFFDHVKANEGEY